MSKEQNLGNKDKALHIGVVIERMVGKQFKHKNGNIYTVLFLTNTDSTPERLKDHPIDVVYMGQNGKIWSRQLNDWDRSFTEYAL
jgi:hypothetical protein